MAKINARGTRQVGPTLYTERLLDIEILDEGPRIYYEAWRLRSDGAVLTRIISTRPPEGVEGHTTKHSSTFRIAGRMRHGADAKIEDLIAFLERRAYVIVKRSY